MLPNRIDVQPAEKSTGAWAGRSDAPLRVGFVSVFDPHDPDQLSGMPYAGWQALAARGVDLVPLVANRRAGGPDGPRGGLRTPGRQPGLRLRGRFLSWVECQPMWGDYRRQLRRAAAQGRVVQERLVGQRLDALFGVCVSTALFQIETSLPIFYAGDATARLINETYPEYACRGSEYKRACDEIERDALARVALGFFASQRTAQSAIDDYGLAPERVRIVPLGANILPQPGEVIEPSAPGCDRLQLLVIAADPVRKRLDFCVAVAELLARGAFREVELVQVGPTTPAARRSKVVRCLGQLRLSDPAQRQILREALRTSHFLLLPSVGEMFGIAPCEAAHHGRPSLVSDVGGLPTVVEHGRTGLVLPLSATPADYAEAIESIGADAEVYLAMAHRALERARKLFTWQAWADTILTGMHETLSRGKT